MVPTFKVLPFTRNLLLGLLILYYSQGIVIPQGSVLSQLVLLIILGFSSVYFIKVLAIRKNPLLIKAWTALLLINVLSFIFTGEFLNNTQHFDYLKAILVVLLPFYPFYYFAIKGHLKNKHFLIFFVFMLFITVMQFNAAEVLRMEHSIKEFGVNNVSYSFVGLIPFVFLIRKRILAYLCLAIISYFLILGAKRGALVVGVLGLILYAYYQIRTIPKKKQFQAYGMIIVGLAAIGYYVNKLYSQNLYLQQRMNTLDAGGYSGRDVIYANIFNHWLNSDNILNLVLGFGFLSSIELSGTGNVAHNDWLELLANTGLIGLSVYFVLFYSGFKSSFNTCRDKDKKLLLFTIFLIWFVTTLFSMGFNASSFTGMFLIIAYLMGSKSEKLI